MNPPRAYCCPCCGRPWGVVVAGRLSGGAFEALERSRLRCAFCGNIKHWDPERDGKPPAPLDTGGAARQE